MSPNEAMKQLNEAVGRCLQAGIKITAGKLYPTKQVIIAFPEEVIHDKENGVFFYDGVKGKGTKGDT